MQVPQERLFLDTNILFVLLSRKEINPGRSLLLNEYSPFENRRYKTCINTLVSAEIKALVKSKSKPAVLDALPEVLDKMSTLKINNEVVEEYVTLRTAAFSKNLNIKHNDLWIAATAIANDCFIITFDRDDFTKIKSISTKLKIHCLNMNDVLLGQLVIL